MRITAQAGMLMARACQRTHRVFVALTRDQRTVRKHSEADVSMVRRGADSKCTRSSYPYFIKYNTRWSDNDQYAHVNNAVYYQMIDSIVNTYLEKHCGLKPRLTMACEGSHSSQPPIGLVVSSHCKFFSPLSFPQKLDIGLRVVKLGRSSVEYEIGIFAEEDQEASAVGGYVHVFVDRFTRKPLSNGFEGVLRRGLQEICSEGVSSSERIKTAKL